MFCFLPFQHLGCLLWIKASGFSSQELTLPPLSVPEVQVSVTPVLSTPGVGNIQVDNSGMGLLMVHFGKRSFFFPSVIKPEGFEPGAADGHFDTQWRAFALE